MSPKACRADKVPRPCPSTKVGKPIGSATEDTTRVVACPSRRADEWKVVSDRGARGLVLRKRCVGDASAEPLAVSNRFEVLSDLEHSPVATEEAGPKGSRGGKGVLVIGSSNVRRIMPPMLQRARREGVCERVFSRCIPGGTVPQVTMELKTAVRETGCSSLRVVAHVGTNDASRRGSEEILDSFEDLVSEVARVRESSGVSIGLSICSIVPRIDRGRTVWSRVVGLNRRLRDFCRGKGVDFVELGNVLDSCRAPLNGSGVHYTTEAAGKVARRVFRDVGVFLG